MADWHNKHEGPLHALDWNLSFYTDHSHFDSHTHGRSILKRILKGRYRIYVSNIFINLLLALNLYYIILFIFLFSHFPLFHIQENYFSDITRNTPSPNDITLLGWCHSWQFCEQNWTLVFRSFLFIFWYILQRGWQIPPGIT